MGERRNICKIYLLKGLIKKGITQKIGVYMDLGGYGSSSG
jgi:hypothetical protein